VLVLVCIVILAIIGIRFYHMSVTGYMLPDEAYYYERIVLGHKLYEGREIFSAIYIFFFEWVRNVPSLIFAGVVYTATWGIGTAALAYVIARRLGIPDQQSSLLLLSLMFFPVYLIMLPMMLTETMGLFFALLGIYFLLRFSQRGGWTDVLASSLSFATASKVREAYLLFGLANFVAVLVSSKRSLRSTLAYGIPLVAAVVSVDPMLVQMVIQRLDMLIASLSGFQASGQVAAGLATVARTTTTIAFPLRPPESFLYASAIGLIVGYNPIFAIIALASVLLAVWAAWRRRTAATSLPPWNALIGLGAYESALLLLAPTPATGLIPVWTSAAARASHASLPVLFTFNHAYGRLGSKTVVGVLLVLLVLGSTQFPVITQAIQSNLTRTGTAVDRLNFDYRAPYYRLYQLAKDSGRTIVFALDLRGARTYLSMLLNVQVSLVPANETTFNTLLAQGWDTIYLYDSYYTVIDPSSLQLYPEYYREILISHLYPGYTIETLWVDGESYAFKMTPVAATQT
jgi:hypothetical protein